MTPTAVVRNLDPSATMRDVRGDLGFRLPFRKGSSVEDTAICNLLPSNIVTIHKELSPGQNFLAPQGPGVPLAVRKARKSFDTVASGNSRHSDYPERSRDSVYFAPGTWRRSG